MTENELDLINRRNIDCFNALNSENRSFILHIMNTLGRSSLKDSDLRSLQNDLVSMAAEAEASGTSLQSMLGMTAEAFCENMLDTFEAKRSGKALVFLQSLCAMYFIGFIFLIFFSDRNIALLVYYAVLFLGLSYLNTYMRTKLTLRKKDPQVWHFFLWFLAFLIPGLALSLFNGFGDHAPAVPLGAAVCGLAITGVGAAVATILLKKK